MGDDYASDEDPDPFGFEEAGDDQGTPGDDGPCGTPQPGVPSEVRKKMDEQSAYICQLEDTNLKLQERIYLLERDLQELQRGAAGSSRPEVAAEATEGSGSDQRLDEEDEDEDARSIADADIDGDNVIDASSQ